MWLWRSIYSRAFHEKLKLHFSMKPGEKGVWSLQDAPNELRLFAARSRGKERC